MVGCINERLEWCTSLHRKSSRSWRKATELEVFPLLMRCSNRLPSVWQSGSNRHAVSRLWSTMKERREPSQALPHTSRPSHPDMRQRLSRDSCHLGTSLAEAFPLTCRFWTRTSWVSQACSQEEAEHCTPNGWPLPRFHRLLTLIWGQSYLTQNVYDVSVVNY